MDGQPLIVRVTVFHHARFALLTSSGAALCAVTAAVQRIFPLAPEAPWIVIAVATLLVAAALLTSFAKFGEQPVFVSAQGLQIGTLFNDLRGEDLRASSIKNGEAKL